MSFLLALLSLAMFLAAGLDYVETRRLEKLRRKAALSSEGQVKTFLKERGWTHILGPVMIMGKNQRTAEIDVIVVMDNGIAIVVESKHWSGIICGGRSEHEWRAIKSDGSFIRHRNPIFQAERQARILKEVSGVTCSSLVVMVGKGSPQEGYWPYGVTSLQNLEENLYKIRDKTKNKKGMTQESAWLKISSLIEDAQAKEIHLSKIEAMEQKKWLSWLSIAVVLASASIFIQNDITFHMEYFLFMRR